MTGISPEYLKMLKAELCSRRRRMTERNTREWISKKENKKELSQRNIAVARAITSTAIMLWR